MPTILYHTGRARLATLSLAPCLVLAAGCPADTATTTESATTSTSSTSTSSDTTSPDPTTGTTGTTTDAPTTTDVPTTDPLTSTSTGPGPAVCGDGVIADTEVCDDGNDEPDDGCNKACERTAAVEWTYTYNGAASKSDAANGIAVDAAGTIIIAGVEYDVNSKGDALLIALSPDGELLWKKTFGGDAGLHDAFTEVVLDDAGNIYVSGYEETGDDDAADAIVRAFDPDGEALWTYKDPPPVAKFSQVRDLVLAGGALYSVGHENLLDNGAQLVARRHDLATGEAAWKTITQAEQLRAVGYGVAMSGANVVAVGQTRSDGNIFSPLIVVLSDAGAILSTDVEDHPNGIWFDATPIGDAGDLILAGRRHPPGVTGPDVAVRRVGPDLAEQWTYLEDHDFLYDSATDVAVGPDEAILVAGQVVKTGQLSDVYASLLTGDGAHVWSHTYNNPEIEIDDFGNAAAFGPGFAVVAGAETVFSESNNVWVRRFKVD